MKGKRIGWLGTCSTPYCGSVEGYFCVRCRMYTADCACHSNYGGCKCETHCRQRFDPLDVVDPSPLLLRVICREVQ